jgi:hypothetical protein
MLCRIPEHIKNLGCRQNGLADINCLHIDRSQLGDGEVGDGTHGAQQEDEESDAYRKSLLAIRWRVYEIG